MLIALAAGLGAAVALPATTTAASGWKVRPSPNVSAADNFLSGVSCPASSSCTAVGYSSIDTERVLVERWNGVPWSMQATPAIPRSTADELTGVACSSPHACIAVGYYAMGYLSTTLAEIWNGTRWTPQTPGAPSGATNSALDSVSCRSARACTAVGYYATGDVPTFPVAAHWDGAHWSIQPAAQPLAGSSSELTGVSCGSTSACIAVGYYTIGAAFPMLQRILAERWDGRRWTLSGAPTPRGAKDASLSAVSCRSANACMAVGFYISQGGAKLLLAERWNGRSWSIQTVAPPKQANGAFLLAGVACPAAHVCVAVGSYAHSESTATGVGTKYFTLAEHWDGHKWSIRRTPSPGLRNGTDLTGVSCPSSKHCAAVGRYRRPSGASYLTLIEVGS